jgi:glutathione S-transferase
MKTKKKEAWEIALNSLKQVEQWLAASTNGYVAGGSGPSIADLQAYHEILSAVEFKFFNIDEFPHIKKWYHKLSEREAIKQACVGFHEIKKHFK